MKGKAIRTIHMGAKHYAAGDRIELPDDQFCTFEQLGMVERLPEKAIAVSGDTPPVRERAFLNRSKKL